MKEKLKALLDSKEKLFEDQKIFSRMLIQKYPALLSEDISEHINNIDKEMEFLLSSTLKRKSDRLKIPVKDVGYHDFVVLTRNPGLKYSYSSGSAFQPSEILELGKNGDLLKVRDGYNEKKGIVKLSILKDSVQIDQEKLKIYYAYLKELIDWKTRDKVFANREHAYDDHKKDGVMIGIHKVIFFHKSFSLSIRGNKVGRSYSKFDEISAGKMREFSIDNWNNEPDEDEFEETNEKDLPSIENQKALLILWDRFDEFDKVLLEYNSLKNKLIVEAKDLFKRLQEYNKPFRILNKLING